MLETATLDHLTSSELDYKNNLEKVHFFLKNSTDQIMLDTEAIVEIKQALINWSVRSKTPITEVKRQLASLESMAQACNDRQVALSLKLLDFSI